MSLSIKLGLCYNKHDMEISIKQLIEYWEKTAEHDYKRIDSLFKNKYYDFCLFAGHLILEKILKAHVVKTTNKRTPYIHDLSELSKRAKLELSEEENDFLAYANRFNIRSRYPDYKFRFYKSCTPAYTKENLIRIKSLYKKLCKLL